MVFSMSANTRFPARQRAKLSGAAQASVQDRCDHSPVPPAARDAHEPDPETEPDARFTLANQRTFLAWSRTALALVVAGLGIVQLLPPFPGIPWGRHALGIPLIVLGAVVAVSAYWEWSRNQAALRRGQPLPRSLLPRILMGTIAGAAAVSAAVLIASSAR
jgi:putative membrane protein